MQLMAEDGYLPTIPTCSEESAQTTVLDKFRDETH